MYQSISKQAPTGRRSDPDDLNTFDDVEVVIASHNRHVIRDGGGGNP